MELVNHILKRKQTEKRLHLSNKHGRNIGQAVGETIKDPGNNIRKQTSDKLLLFNKHGRNTGETIEEPMKETKP